MLNFPKEPESKIFLNRARSVPALRRIAFKQRKMKSYVIELFNPPYPNVRRQIRVHFVSSTWTRDRLSPNMIKTWTVAALSKDHALAELIKHLDGGTRQ